MQSVSKLPASAQRVAELLLAIGHGKPVILLPASGRTSAEAAAGLGCSVAEIAKSIVFRRLADEHAVMVIASGAHRVDEHKVAALVGRLGKADARFVREHTGYAIGGGHVLHMLCDLTIAADNARFGQTGPKVGSFDGGYGASYMARIVGQKKAREIWFLCRQYDAQQALQMGLVNTVVPVAELEAETVKWCREMLRLSPTALRVLKAGFNADSDGLSGVQELAGNATALFYMTEEGQEGRNAFNEKRPPDFSKFPPRP